MGKKKPNVVATETAVFACGCFWSKEYWFQQAEGVVSTRVGYTGGHTEHPTYKEVCKKQTGHAEAVEVTFRTDMTSFADLCRLFFDMHNPTIDRRDKGGQYRSAIFYKNEKQKMVAEEMMDEMKKEGLQVVTELAAADMFWQAEARHQKYCDSRGMVPRKISFR